MHEYARCISTKAQGDCKRDLRTANLLSFGSRRDTTFFLIFRRWKNFIALQSIFGTGNMRRCILVDKIVHDKDNNDCLGQESSRISCTIMHVHNFPSPESRPLPWDLC